jgi:CheY-like chemotaxis protein
MPKCILTVDDDPVVQELVQRTLRKNGYETISATNGEDALELLKNNKPDLILLDVQMPKMDGYAFIIDKSKVPELEKIPIIVLTSFKETEPLFKRHGVKAYLLKPIDINEMLGKIQATITA